MENISQIGRANVLAEILYQFGVCYSKKDKRWIATININKKHTVIGYYKNLEEAKIARELAEKEYYRDFSYIKSMEIAEGIKIKDGE